MGDENKKTSNSLRPLKYGDRLMRMEGIITEVHDGCVEVDLKGRLGALKIPMRMLISDAPVKKGQVVAWNMSLIEQLSPNADEKRKEECG